MRYAMWLAVLGLGISVSAFSQAPGNPTVNPSDPLNGHSDLIVVAGCVQPQTPESGRGKDASAGTNRSTQQYVLFNAMRRMASGDASAPSAVGSTATPAPAGSTTAATMSVLLDGHEADLSKEVGHQVEITGTFDVANRPAEFPLTRTEAADRASKNEPLPKAGEVRAADANGNNAGMQRLRVSSLRKTAESCTATGQR